MLWHIRPKGAPEVEAHRRDPATVRDTRRDLAPEGAEDVERVSEPAAPPRA